MFSGCSNLETLNLSSLKITYAGMFSGCTSLKEIDLSGLGQMGSNSSMMAGLFSGFSSLEKIYVSEDFDASNQPAGMSIFGNNSSLVGGNGTTFDSTKVDKTMAVIDTPEHPGYLTNVADKPNN